MLSLSIFIFYVDDKGEETTCYTFMSVIEGKEVFIALYDNQNEAFKIGELKEGDMSEYRCPGGVIRKLTLYRLND